MKLRIKPVEQPKGLFSTIMYLLMQKEYGKVITPAKVIYARYPKIGLLVRKLYKVEESLSLVRPLDKLLIQNLVATLNGCSFCMDISKRKSLNKSMGLEKFQDLMRYEKSERFSNREKAVFTFVAEMTEKIDVSDQTFERLRKYCSDEEIIEITYIAASENYLNRLIRPLNIGSDELCELK